MLLYEEEGLKEEETMKIHYFKTRAAPRCAAPRRALAHSLTASRRA